MTLDANGDDEEADPTQAQQSQAAPDPDHSTASSGYLQFAAPTPTPVFAPYGSYGYFSLIRLVSPRAHPATGSFPMPALARLAVGLEPAPSPPTDSQPWSKRTFEQVRRLRTACRALQTSDLWSRLDGVSPRSTDLF